MLQVIQKYDVLYISDFGDSMDENNLFVSYFVTEVLLFLWNPSEPCLTMLSCWHLILAFVTLATYYWFSLDQAQTVIFIKNIHLIFNTLFELWIQFACHEGMHQQGI